MRQSKDKKKVDYQKDKEPICRYCGAPLSTLKVVDFCKVCGNKNNSKDNDNEAIMKL